MPRVRATPPRERARRRRRCLQRKRFWVMLEMGRLICTALYGYDYRIYGVPDMWEEGCFASLLNKSKSHHTSIHNLFIETSILVSLTPIRVFYMCPSSDGVPDHCAICTSAHDADRHFGSYLFEPLHPPPTASPTSPLQPTVYCRQMDQIIRQLVPYPVQS